MSKIKTNISVYFPFHTLFLIILIYSNIMIRTVAPILFKPAVGIQRIGVYLCHLNEVMVVKRLEILTVLRLRHQHLRLS